MFRSSGGSGPYARSVARDYRLGGEGVGGGDTCTFRGGGGVHSIISYRYV